MALTHRAKLDLEPTQESLLILKHLHEHVCRTVSGVSDDSFPEASSFKPTWALEAILDTLFCAALPEKGEL